MELYKYCKREHVPLKGTSGLLRIGTLYDYKKTDKYGEFVSDMHEGSKLISGTAMDLNANNFHLYPGLRGLINLDGGGSIGRVEVSNCTLMCPDMYIFLRPESIRVQNTSGGTWKRGMTRAIKSIPRVFSFAKYHGFLARALSSSDSLLSIMSRDLTYRLLTCIPQ